MKKYLIKKYLLILLVVLIAFLGGCKKDKDFEPSVIEASHVNSLLDDNLQSFMIVKGKPSTDGYLQAMTFYATILKNDITNRMLEYYQVDYTSNNGEKDTYYHFFDSIDGVMRAYSQGFFPYINYKNGSNIEEFSVYVEYTYDENNTGVTKKISYYEKMLDYDETNFNVDKVDVGFNLYTTVSYDEVEKCNRYKLYFFFDDKVYLNGHFDVQTYLELSDGSIMPFYGLYNYPVALGSYSTVSDEIINSSYEIINVYWQINHYDLDGKVISQYYKEKLV